MYWSHCLAGNSGAMPILISICQMVNVTLKAAPNNMIHIQSLYTAIGWLCDISGKIQKVVIWNDLQSKPHFLTSQKWVVLYLDMPYLSSNLASLSQLLANPHTLINVTSCGTTAWYSVILGLKVGVRMISGSVRKSSSSGKAEGSEIVHCTGISNASDVHVHSNSHNVNYPLPFKPLLVYQQQPGTKDPLIQQCSPKLVLYQKSIIHSIIHSVNLDKQRKID